MRHLVKFLLLILIVVSTTGCFSMKPPRCKTPGCHVKMIHPHAGKNYRGRPWWVFNQNPKIGQEYKPGKRSKY